MKPITNPPIILSKLCKSEKKCGLVVIVEGSLKELKRIFPEMKPPWLVSMHKMGIGYFFFQNTNHLDSFQRKVLNNYRNSNSNVKFLWYAADNDGRLY